MLALWCLPPSPPPMPLGISYEVVLVGLLANCALMATASYLLLDRILFSRLSFGGRVFARIPLGASQGLLGMIGFALVDETILWQTRPNPQMIYSVIRGSAEFLWLPLLIFGIGLTLADGFQKKMGFRKSLFLGLLIVFLATSLAGFLSDIPTAIGWGIFILYLFVIHPLFRKALEWWKPEVPQNAWGPNSGATLED